MDALDKVQDMSVEGGTSWQIVTVRAGDDFHSKTFQVHLQRLGPWATKLDFMPGIQFWFSAETPETFNLAMNWSYGFGLPRIPYLHSHSPRALFNLTIKMDALKDKMPSAHQFGPPASLAPDGTKEIWLYHTIVTMPPYSAFSVEELRLFYTADTAPRAPRKEAASIIGPKPQFPPNIMSIPATIPDSEATRAEAIQVELLELLLFAEGCKWELLFNEAMEAFRYGETQLRRLYVPETYVKRVFTPEYRPRCQTQNFIGDYALDLAFEYKHLDKYNPIIASAPGFFTFLDEYQKTAKPMKTHRTKMAYHIHGGKYVKDCDCPVARGQTTFPKV
ncbi:hypothetical protein F5Y17DRAFT_412684 [Xylariaceae sp. FL0594]|nr:hypothetical protein F5Y17DRAFT_412684 [Xylariaceae sp. FL0594]